MPYMAQWWWTRVCLNLTLYICHVQLSVCLKLHVVNMPLNMFGSLSHSNNAFHVVATLALSAEEAIHTPQQ